MSTHSVAVIGGDGIGPEVIEQAIRVADHMAKADFGVTGINGPR